VEEGKHRLLYWLPKVAEASGEAQKASAGVETPLAFISQKGQQSP
jgi:hypothetical protein